MVDPDISSWRTLKEISNSTDKYQVNFNNHTPEFSNFSNPITISSILGVLFLSFVVSIVLCKQNCKTSSFFMNVENPPQCMYNYPEMDKMSRHNEDTDMSCSHELNEIETNKSPYETIDFNSDDSSDIISANRIGCQQERVFLSHPKADLFEDVDFTEYLSPTFLKKKTKTVTDTNDDKYLTVV